VAESVYHFNPDQELVAELTRGLKLNQDRYGYRSCPCRRASGRIEEDRDIICPCVYRAPDVAEYGSCFCGLYVSAQVASGEKQLAPVPERRPPRAGRTAP
jgi:ferredoxin-thioredoxin reductase catalytic chain